MNPQHQALVESVRELYPLPHDEAHAYARQFRLKTLSKNEFFLREGEPAVLVGFVTEGVVREFFTNRNAREFNKNFALKGDFTGSYYDLIRQGPSTVSIQALAETEILVAPFQKVSEIFESSYHWQCYARKFVESLFMKKARRENELTTLSAQERYENFLRENPRLFSRIPHYQIASYLAITPVALSRIRKRLAPPARPQFFAK